MKLGLVAFLLAAASVRIVHDNGHKIVIETQSGVQHITVTDRHGSLEAESWCDSQSGTYDQIVTLGQALVAAAKRDDRSALVSLMQFPLRVNFGSAHTVWVHDRAALLARFDRIVTPQMIALLVQDQPHDAFCRNGMSMVAGGLMWATTNAHGNLRVAVINH